MARTKAVEPKEEEPNVFVMVGQQWDANATVFDHTGTAISDLPNAISQAYLEAIDDGADKDEVVIWIAFEVKPTLETKVIVDPADIGRVRQFFA